MRTKRIGPWRLGVLALLAACEHDADDVVVPTDDDLSFHTDVETQRPADTDRPVVDTPPGDTGLHTDLPPNPPPADWGPGFTDLTAELGGAVDVDPGSSSDQRPAEAITVFLTDLDDDGVTELVTTRRWGPGTLPPARQARVWRWTAAGLEPAPSLAQALQDADWSTWGAVDLDGDGHTDLLLEGDRPVRWARPEGGWDPPAPLTLPTIDWRPSFGHGVFDLDDDGLLDLLFTSDACDGATLPVLQIAPRTFAVRADLTEPAAEGLYSRAMLSLRLPDGGQVHQEVGAACDPSTAPPGFLRMAGRTPDGDPRFEPFDATPDAWWRRLAAHVDAPISAVRPRGAAAADLDGDHVLDLVASVRLPRQAVLQGAGDGTFLDVGVSSIRHATAPTGHELPWSVALPDLDQDGRPDVLITHGDDELSFLREQGHLMGPRAWWNADELVFVDVTDALGLEPLGAWRGLALGDPDGDGDADLVIGGQGVPSRVYRNDIDAGHHGLSLRLRGTVSGDTAPGARVQVHAAGLPVQLLVPGAVGNPSGLSEPLAFVGLGTAQRADRVRVTWPSGLVQEVANLQAGKRHTIVEPRVFEFVQPERAARANGSDVVEVWIRPPTRNGGQVDATATVKVALEGAPATLVGGVDTWTGQRKWTLRAPATPGTTRLVITINGVTLQVKPRITWR